MCCLWSKSRLDTDVTTHSGFTMFSNFKFVYCNGGVIDGCLFRSIFMTADCMLDELNADTLCIELL